jgi:hypothetical protein
VDCPLTPSVRVFDVSETLIGFESMAPVFENLFGALVASFASGPILRSDSNPDFLALCMRKTSCDATIVAGTLTRYPNGDSTSALLGCPGGAATTFNKDMPEELGRVTDVMDISPQEGEHQWPQ